jgi:predicted Zn-ribbon and HTH transcriptional regulator
MAAANFTKDVDELRKRIEKLEKSLKKIEALEKRMDQAVEAIRKVASSVPKGVDKQVQLIWQGLQSTPDYNLYEKFVCKKCGGAGAAQIKSRCGHCGAEGWFGKREARPSPLTPPLSATPRSGARPSSKK